MPSKRHHSFSFIFLFFSFRTLVFVPSADRLNGVLVPSRGRKTCQPRRRVTSCYRRTTPDSAAVFPNYAGRYARRRTRLCVFHGLQNDGKADGFFSQ